VSVRALSLVASASQLAEISQQVSRAFCNRSVALRSVVGISGGNQLAVLMRPIAVASWTEQRKTLIGCLPRSLACLDVVA